MPFEYGTLFLVVMLTGWAATPLCLHLARALDLVDHPAERKVHVQPIPYLGGLAIYAAVAAGCIYVAVWAPHLLYAQSIQPSLLVLFGVATCFHVLGLIDDAVSLSAVLKMTVQIILASVLVSQGFTITQMTSPIGGVLPLGWVGGVLSVIWIITLVNAINFIDGLDGLAAGVVFFAALANFLISLDPWQNFVCITSLMLMGACLGFLPYNFSPAKIFMGDAGSLFLGVMLAGGSLASNVKGATVMSLSLPLVILTIPLIDATLTVIRRGRRGVHLFKADREHIHHRLLRLGLSDRRAVLLLYGLCFLLSMAAVLASKLPPRYTFLFILVFLAAVGWGYFAFHTLERRAMAFNGETSPPPQQ
ncbi:MAG: MraY family glycosyltransferase [Candidatus Hinthialibacter antarcticus]|nr:MraY family glycosyltransferase [Candidatus Hinthialibacter antarcticus]